MLSFLSLALPCLIAFSDAAAQEPAAEKYPISVLYAGYPGGAREKAFVSFLEKSFTRVAAIDLRKLDEKSAADFDVVIADWKNRYVNGKYDDTEPHGHQLPQSYSKPTILIGAVAAEASPRTKLDWL